MTTTETEAVAEEQTPEQLRRTAMEEKLASLHAEQAKAVEAGGKYIARHKERGKLTARERIELLVDEGSAFLELMPLAGWGQRLRGRGPRSSRASASSRASSA